MTLSAIFLKSMIYGPTIYITANNVALIPCGTTVGKKAISDSCGYCNYLHYDVVLPAVINKREY